MARKSDSDNIIVHGAAAIGAVLRMSRRQAFYRLKNGELPARKIGRHWVAVRSELLDAMRSTETRL